MKSLKDTARAAVVEEIYALSPLVALDLDEYVQRWASAVCKERDVVREWLSAVSLTVVSDDVGMSAIEETDAQSELG